MKRAVGYARFSSINQDQNSIEMQTQEIRAYAEKNGYELVAIIADEDNTGRDDARENFIQMFNRIKRRELQVDVILIYKQSRFFRNTILWGVYEERMKKMNISWISVTEPLPENEALAKLQKTVVRAIDEYTSDNIGVLSRDGTKNVVRNGYWSGGPAPIGYQRTKVPNREGHTRKAQLVMRGTLIRDERLAPIVIRIFEIAAQTGKGGCLILKQLHAEFGIPILGPKGAPLTGGAVNAILKNPIYKGKVIYNDYRCETLMGELAIDGGKKHKKRTRKAETEWVVVQNDEWRLVSDEIWEAAQKAREGKPALGFGRGDRRAAYALTGLLVCGVCGKHCGGKWQASKNASYSENSRYFYYRCRGAMNGSTACSNKTKIRGEELENAVVDAVMAELLDEKFVEDVAMEVIEISGRHAQSIDRNALEKRRQEISAEQSRVVDLAAKVGGDIEPLARRIREYERERAEIDRKLAHGRSVRIPTVEELRPKIQERLAQVRGLFSFEHDIDDLRVLLQKWIEKIRIDGDGKVFIKWKLSSVFDLLGEQKMSVSEVVGSLQLANGYRPLSLTGRAARPRVSGELIGFIGFSGTAGSESNGCSEQVPVVGFSGFSGFSGMVPQVSGFSGSAA